MVQRRTPGKSELAESSGRRIPVSAPSNAYLFPGSMQVESAQKWIQLTQDKPRLLKHFLSFFLLREDWARPARGHVVHADRRGPDANNLWRRLQSLP